MATNGLGPLLTSLLERDEVVSGQLPPYIGQADARYSRLEDHFIHSEQSSRPEAHHQVRQLDLTERTPLVRTAARVERSAWSRMSGWARAFFIGGLVLGLVPGLLFYGIYSCCNPDIDQDEFEPIVGQTASSHEPVRLRIPDFTARDEEVEPVGGYFGAGPVQRGREEAEEKLQGLEGYSLAESQMLDQTCGELEILAQGSGKDSEAFKQALQEGQSYEDLGLKYYRWSKGPNEIPNANKAAIKEQYSLAQACKSRIDGLRIDIRNKREAIRADFSSSQQFKEMVEQGMPYELYFGEEHFIQDISLGPRAPFRNYPRTRAELNFNLAQWATSQDSIQLNSSDPAFVAQQYLYQLSRPEIMTLSHDQERSLRQAGLNLVPRRGHRVYLENEGATLVIRSVRSIDLKNAEETVEKSYQWTETIRVTPGEPECHVTITKNVQEIE